MPTVYIRCPKTLAAVPVIVGMSVSQFAQASLEGKEITCLECGAVHVWRKADAWLDDEPPARRSVRRA